MISTNDFRNGVTIELDGEVWVVVEFLHVKPGKGSAFVRSKLKNVRTGAVVERTFRAGEKVPRAHMERREMQYLYRSGDQLFFMDSQTFEQMPLNEDQIGDASSYLKEGATIAVLMYQGQVIGVDLPTAVDLEVVQTDPGVRGDTASGGTKPAKLETGLVVQVPLFINVGDVVRVDTRTGAYVERV
ncbi:MAG: elongation factor P [Acetobacteraceae bacterium]|nr:elongation factor P [Acetobacteraceae bacterium]